MLEIYAIDKDGNGEQIISLYWFEENGIRDWSGEAHHGKYTFEIFIDGKLVWKSRDEMPINYMPYIW